MHMSSFRVPHFFPTDFAADLAESVGLFSYKRLHEYEEDLHSIRPLPPDANWADKFVEQAKKSKVQQAEEEGMRLREFQQLAVYGSFEEALYAYTNQEITEDQAKVLAKIHESTQTWVKGSVADKAIQMLKKSEDPKLIKEMSILLLETLGTSSSGPATKDKAQAVRRLVYKYSGADS